MKDPRRHGTYTRTRRAYLDGFAGGPAPCAICGGTVNTSLPGTHPYGPTIEHRIPVRRMRYMVQTWAELLALACDTSLWAVAHQRCQSRQGGRSSAERAPKSASRNKNSRTW